MIDDVCYGIMLVNNLEKADPNDEMSEAGVISKGTFPVRFYVAGIKVKS